VRLRNTIVFHSSLIHDKISNLSRAIRDGQVTAMVDVLPVAGGNLSALVVRIMFGIQKNAINPFSLRNQQMQVGNHLTDLTVVVI